MPRRLFAGVAMAGDFDATEVVSQPASQSVVCAM